LEIFLILKCLNHSNVFWLFFILLALNEIDCFIFYGECDEIEDFQSTCKILKLLLIFNIYVKLSIFIQENEENIELIYV